MMMPYTLRVIIILTLAAAMWLACGNWEQRPTPPPATPYTLQPADPQPWPTASEPLVP